MPRLIRNPKDFWSGVMFLVFSLATIVIGQDYSMGTAGRMGPAYFPVVLGALLGVIGLITMLRALWLPGAPMEKFAYRNTLLILAATVLFGLLVRGAGMILAILVLVIISAYASTKFTWKGTLLLAIGSALFCVLVFVKGLGLPIPVIGPWFGS